MEDLRQQYELLAQKCNDAIENVFQERATMYPMIKDAMYYSLMSGGKRLRGVLLLSAYQLFDEDMEWILPFSAAMEMIHCYSLIHDDLPAMDDDDYRRGNPTCHKVFGEANAILAGDGLLNLAFETMIDATIKLEGERQSCALLAMRRIAKASGVAGMIGGQAADIEAEEKQQHDEHKLYYIQTHKTGALIEAAVVAGATLANAPLAKQHALSIYGSELGLAFQASDDILDVTGDAQLMGKAIGKDAQSNKLTVVSLHGLEKAKVLLSNEINLADNALHTFGQHADLLRYIVAQNSTRQK